MKGLAVVKNTKAAPAFGVLAIYTCPKSLAKAVEWALQAEFEHFQIQWQNQELEPGTLTAIISWSSATGTASRLASSLQQIPNLIFEITEHNETSAANERFIFTPTLGMFRADMDAAGNHTFTENRISALLETHGADVVKLNEEMNRMLGRAWDAELDAYRENQLAESQSWIRAV